MDNTFSYTIRVTTDEAATIAAQHPEWDIERTYTYDADASRKQRERAKAKRAADMAELAQLRELAKTIQPK